MTAPAAQGAPSAFEVRSVAVITCALAAGFAAFVATRYLFTGDPDHYAGLAQSIARGGGYVVNNHPETKFPPGFPLMLAPAALLFKSSFAAIARWAALLAAVAFPLTFLMLRERREPFALPLALASVTSVSYLLLATGNPMSEPTFLAWSMALLLWADGWERDPPGARSWASLGLGSLLVVATASTRMVGAAVIPAAGLVVLWRVMHRRFSIRDTLPLVAGLVYLGAWMAWTRTHPPPWASTGPDAGYATLLLLADPTHPDLGRATLGQLAGRLGANIVRQAAHAVELLTQLAWLKPAWYSPALLLIPMVGAGWWRHLRSGGAFAAFYFASYLGIVLLWPFDEGARFLVPLAPLFLLYAIDGIRAAAAAIQHHASGVRRAAVAWTVVALAGAVAWTRLTGATRSRQDDLAAAFWAGALVVVLGAFPAIAARVPRLRPRVSARMIGMAATLYAVAGLAFASPRIAAAKAGTLPPLSTEHALENASGWIVANTPATAVIQTTWPERLNFATGRPAIILPVTAVRERLREFGTTHHTDFLVVLDDPPYPYVSPSDHARFVLVDGLFPSRWSLVAELPRAQVYRAQ